MRSLMVPSMLVAVALAGCTTVTVPDDAVVDTHDALPEGTLWAWTNATHPNFTVIHGYFEYDGPDLLHTAECNPHGAWNLTILDPSGDAVLFDPRPCTHSEYQPQSYSHKESFQFTWTHDEFERYRSSSRAEWPPSAPVAPGDYTAILQFGVAWQPDAAFEVRLPVKVA